MLEQAHYSQNYASIINSSLTLHEKHLACAEAVQSIIMEAEVEEEKEPGFSCLRMRVIISY